MALKRVASYNPLYLPSYPTTLHNEIVRLWTLKRGICLENAALLAHHMIYIRLQAT